MDELLVTLISIYCYIGLAWEGVFIAFTMTQNGLTKLTWKTYLVYPLLIIGWPIGVYMHFQRREVDAHWTTNWFFNTIERIQRSLENSVYELSYTIEDDSFLLTITKDGKHLSQVTYLYWKDIKDQELIIDYVKRRVKHVR